MKTAAEAHFDALIEQRRFQGRSTYGKGLTHTDAYDWRQMALEEALDLAQYLAAENLRLRERLAALRAEIAATVAWPEGEQPVGIVQEEMRRVRNALADEIRKERP